MNHPHASTNKASEWPSVGALAAPLVKRLIVDAPQLGIGIEPGAAGCTIVDAGIAWPGGIDAGLRIAEICMAGLGEVRLVTDSILPHWTQFLSVRTADPVLACLGSQYAGWSLSFGEGANAYHALGSGPGRAVAAKEEFFAELSYRDKADSACLVLEVEKPPPEGLIEKIIRDCNINGENLTLILTPTGSIAGTVQIVARVLEVALHKVHILGYPLEWIVDGEGSAPLPPPGSTQIEAMGRTNDAILYGGRVHLTVLGGEEDAEQLANDLPSCSSRDYGGPFAETYKAYDGNFYAIDPMLFSPAEVTVTTADSGRTFKAGHIEPPLVDKSFGYAAG